MEKFLKGRFIVYCKLAQQMVKGLAGLLLLATKEFSVE